MPNNCIRFSLRWPMRHSCDRALKGAVKRVPHKPTYEERIPFFNHLKCDSCPFYPFNGRSSSGDVRCLHVSFFSFVNVIPSFVSDSLKVICSSYVPSGQVEISTSIRHQIDVDFSTFFRRQIKTVEISTSNRRRKCPLGRLMRHSCDRP